MFINGMNINISVQKTKFKSNFLGDKFILITVTFLAYFSTFSLRKHMTIHMYMSLEYTLRV